MLWSESKSLSEQRMKTKQSPTCNRYLKQASKKELIQYLPKILIVIVKFNPIWYKR